LNAYQPKIILVDDHVLMRSGLRQMLEEQELVVVDELDNGSTLLASVAEHKPDLVLLDIEMPVMNGLDALRELKYEHPKLRVLLLTMHDSEALIQRGMFLGANGVVLKDAQPKELLAAVEQVLSQGFYFSEKVSMSLLHGLGRSLPTVDPPGGKVSLTAREWTILRLICQERSTHEIAETVHLSPRTIEGYRSKLMEKVGVKSTVGLVVFAVQNGALDGG